MYLLKTDWALHMITVNDEMLSVLELCTHLASQVLINEMVHATADFEVANTCQEEGTHLKHHLQCMLPSRGLRAWKTLPTRFGLQAELVRGHAKS